jgi:hypothetical protein
MCLRFMTSHYWMTPMMMRIGWTLTLVIQVVMGCHPWVSVLYARGLDCFAFVVHLMKMVTLFRHCHVWLVKLLGLPHRRQLPRRWKGVQASWLWALAWAATGHTPSMGLAPNTCHDRGCALKLPLHP